MTIMFGNQDQERAIGLAELAGLIEGVISENFDRGYWVKAEMARLNLYPESGHCYPDLVEKEGRLIKAQMRGTIWAGNYQRISWKFLEVAREPLKDGLQILCFATVKYHPQYGLSLQISDIDPTFTLGQMARDRQETIRRLREEGIFDRNRSLPFPLLPKRIAVISVLTSKGYSDFIQILEGYASKYAFHISLYPALLQGDRAVDSILGQLKVIRDHAKSFDAVAIIRGGGGDVGLSCYDDYRLAREVATFPLPVITGIGHSTNETVVEMVAARNKITPTDVAYSLAERFEDFENRLEKISEFIVQYAGDLISGNKNNLQELAERLHEEALRQMEYHDRQLDSMMKNTLQHTRFRIMKEKERLGNSLFVMKLAHKRQIRQETDNIQNQEKWLAAAMGTFLAQEKGRVKMAENQVRLLDPVNTLKRGFSITYHNNKPLKEAAEALPGETIKTRLYQGEIISIVKPKEE